MSYITGTTLISNPVTGTPLFPGTTLGTTLSGTTSYNPCGEITLPNSNSFTTVNFNSNNMAQLRQTKIAIFEVTRDKKTNEITSSKFLQELWVEVKNGISIDLVAAKHLKGDYDPETIIVRETTSVYF